MLRAFAAGLLVACTPSSSPPVASPPLVAPDAYDGVTTCGTATARADLGYIEDIKRVQGSLDKDLIRRPIQARSTQLRACYERALAKQPGLAGSVRAKFSIVASGRVGNVEISGFDRGLDACICREILELVYPQFGTARLGTVHVVYPFEFHPTD